MQDKVNQLDQAVSDVFAVMLNMSATASPTDALPVGPPSLSASVHFSGSFAGACTLEIDLLTAAELTSALTGLAPGEIPPELCADTAGELCNMIAGSWKSAQSSIDACNISCPIVIERDDAAQSKSAGIARLYRFAGQHITLTLSLS